jgi:signal transduction histidine kinase
MTPTPGIIHGPPSAATQLVARVGKVCLADTNRAMNKECDFRAVVRISIEAARHLIERRQHELLVTLPDEPLQLIGVPEKLETVVRHLLDNAGRYTPDGGCIWVQLTRETNTAVLRVRDSGAGISTDLLEYLFDFVLPIGVAAHKEGFGIGLAIAKRLVDLHGGSLSAESLGPGCGADFTLRLPGLLNEPSRAANGTDAALSSGGQHVKEFGPRVRLWPQNA